MKKSHFIYTLIALTALVFVSTTFSTSISPVNAEDDSKGTITANGRAKKIVSPDTVEITIGVETRNKKLDNAISENNEKANAIITAVKPLLDLKNSDNIKTTSYRVSPQYFYVKETRKTRIDAYLVTNQVKIRTEKFKSVNNILETALKNGANKIDNLHFYLENKDQVCAELLTEAATKAKTEAEIVAKALGSSIKGIKRVTSSCDSSNPRPMRALYDGLSAKEESAHIPIEAGDLNVNADIYAEFYVR